MYYVFNILLHLCVFFIYSVHEKGNTMKRKKARFEYGKIYVCLRYGVTSYIPCKYSRVLL